MKKNGSKLNNLRAWQTHDENNAIDQMKKKKAKVDWVNFKLKHNASKRFDLYW
jgi:hypothetical protein